MARILMPVFIEIDEKIKEFSFNLVYFLVSGRVNYVSKFDKHKVKLFSSTNVAEDSKKVLMIKFRCIVFIRFTIFYDRTSSSKAWSQAHTSERSRFFSNGGGSLNS